MTDQSSDPRRALDEVQPIDSGALMREVREEVERRRAQGLYPPALDDVPPFGDLGLDDDLVASMHRLESLSRIPGITPVVEEIGAGPGESPIDYQRRTRKAALVDRGLYAARLVARRVVGPTLERVVRAGADYLMAAAQHGRISTGRILDLERRVAELEAELRASGARGSS